MPMRPADPPRGRERAVRRRRPAARTPTTSAGPAWRRLASQLQRLAKADTFRLAFAAFVFLAALWALRQELRGSSLQQIGDVVSSVPLWMVAAAALGTLVSYGGLAASEGLALAWIGRPLAFQRIGLATFVSYAVSNGVGFGLATGGAARLRLYGMWGLSAREVAAVTLLSGAAVTLSGVVLAGLLLLGMPGLPVGALLLGLAFLVPAALWLAPLPRKVWILPDIDLRTPPLGLRVGALLGGFVDWIASGAALFILIPGASSADFLPFLGVFILSSILSAATGVPGGVGVFDALVLMLSREVSQVHETAAALLLYRLVYVLGPLILTAVGVAGYQLRRLMGGGPGKGWRPLADLIAPRVMAALVFYLGAVLLLGAGNFGLTWISAPQP